MKSRCAGLVTIPLVMPKYDGAPESPLIMKGVEPTFQCKRCVYEKRITL